MTASSAARQRLADLGKRWPPMPPTHEYLPAVRAGELIVVSGHSLEQTIEENFQAGRCLTGIDEHQVRHWTSWYRWVTLATLAAAAPAIAA
jgi:hypothetical protein